MRDDKTFNAFVEFCRSKPADETFNYMSNENCAYAQFLKETGRCETPMVGGVDWWPGRGRISEAVGLDDRLVVRPPGQPTILDSKTFGEILERLNLQ